MVELVGTQRTVVVNAALVLAQIAFAGFHVLGKDALLYINAIVFAFYRELIAGPTIVLIGAIFERVKPDIKTDWWRFILLGTTGVYLNQMLFIEGLNLTSATQAAIMQPCTPVFTAALTIALRIEKFSILKIVGIFSSVVGAVVMVGLGNVSFNSQTKGILCLVGNTLAMSVYYILQKPVLKKYPPVSTTGWAYLVGSVEMGLTSLLFTHGKPSNYGVDHHVIVPLAYSIVCATVFSFIAITWANKYSPSSVVAAYNCLQPLATSLFSFIAWGQTPSRDEYIGAVAIIIGLALVTVARSREAKEETEKEVEKEERGEYQPINSSDESQKTSFQATSSPPSLYPSLSPPSYSSFYPSSSPQSPPADHNV